MKKKQIIGGVIIGILAAVISFVWIIEEQLDENWTLKSYFEYTVYNHKQDFKTDIIGNVYPFSGMEPTFENGQYAWCDRSKASMDTLEFLDLVIVQFPVGEVIGVNSYTKDDGVSNVMKRIIGLPGDEIRIDEEGVWRNGKLLEEQYLYSQDWVKPVEPALLELDEPVLETIVPDNHVYLLGDNRDNSVDSRRLEDMTLDLEESFYCKVVSIVEE